MFNKIRNNEFARVSLSGIAVMGILVLITFALTYFFPIF